ncbi:hypothetical protein PGT21_008113 [Puccinia graminis f. sp. tritici]|uniref:Uncharacterized protein n=1 Tax=Puccinia graminis f. sp. tritici TaxID=56615 RepID=A0A5B0PPI0_PUCGR|nr:hypothetical protein PGT21_008113 [Puccinia graminis f. sp. tritici]
MKQDEPVSSPTHSQNVPIKRCIQVQHHNSSSCTRACHNLYDDPARRRPDGIVRAPMLQQQTEDEDGAGDDPRSQSKADSRLTSPEQDPLLELRRRSGNAPLSPPHPMQSRPESSVWTPPSWEVFLRIP